MRLALRRTTSGLLVAGVLLAGDLGTASAPASAADPVRTAERRVAALRAEVGRTAATLTAGTERLEHQRAELAQTRRRLAQARDEVADAQAGADAARVRLSVVVAAAYRSPVPDTVLLALGGPDRLRSALLVQADLRHVRGSTSELLSAATEQRERARDAVRAVEDLTDEAAARTRDVRRQVVSLRRTARRAERTLAVASSRLTAARAAQRASRLRGAVAAACAGGPAGGANGFLPASALCPLVGAPGHALRADAAAAFGRLTAASVADRGTPLCVTDSYRSYPRQVDVFARKPELAAVPGTSRHGYGVALDLGCGVEQFGSEAHRWLQANGARFGWVHPAWAEPGGSKPEPWHWEFAG